MKCHELENHRASFFALFQRKTKQSLIIFVALLTVSMITGCQKKEMGSATIAQRAAGPRGSITSGNQFYGNNLSGRVYADPYQQSAFQQAVTGFLSTDVLPQYVGQVSASGQGNSGVRFGGRVGLINGSLSSILGGYGGGYAMIAGNSQLIIQVIDYLPQYPDAPLIPPFIFGQAQGQIMGNQAQITFSDRYGQVTLQGYLNMQNNSFEGTISYDNNISIDGSTPGAAGTLGNFSVPICAFFACQ